MKKLIVVLVFLLLVSCVPVKPSIPQHDHLTYVPLVVQDAAPIFGAQVEYPTASKIAKIPDGQWMSVTVYWNYSEVVEGVYSWDGDDQPYVVGTDTVLPDTTHNVIIRITGTPTWARVSNQADSMCAAVRKDEWYRFVNFANEVIDRYHPEAIALWVEPEADGLDPTWKWPYFGCWGYQYAELYGEFTKYVYVSVKSAHPEVSIISGEFNGLSLDWITRARDAGLDGDFISFHYYSVYEHPETWTGWMDKYIEIRAILPDRKLLLTETSMQSLGNCSDTGFRNAQADYANNLRENFGWANLSGVIWYTAIDNGWRCTDLCFGGVCYPAYDKWFGGW